MSKRLGVLGGTFDPPHLGHLVLADQAQAQLGLALVLFCPVGQQPLKSGQPVTPVHHRLAMTQLAIADRPGWVISRVDLDRPGPHYTADSLALLHASYPDHALYFLMGADSLNDIPRWYAPDRVILHARLAVARRPGVEPDLPALEQVLPGLRGQITWIDSPWLDVAATDIRRRVQRGWSIHYLVPPPVEAYIEQNGLYR